MLVPESQTAAKLGAESYTQLAGNLPLLRRNFATHTTTGSWSRSRSLTALHSPWRERRHHLGRYATLYPLNIPLSSASHSLAYFQSYIDYLSRELFSTLHRQPQKPQLSDTMSTFPEFPTQIWSPCGGSATITLTEIGTATRTAPNKPISTLSAPFWKWTSLSLEAMLVVLRCLHR
jgi:hypothetical protein